VLTLTAPAPPDEPLPWDTVTTEVEWSAFAVEEGEVVKIVRPATPIPVKSGGAFTIPLICMGIGLIAMCLLIPAADENRQLAYETQRLQADLDQLQKQAATNDMFLKRVANDPVLAERLARRQLKMVPQGTSVLELKGENTATEMSPFLLVTVPPPAPLPPYRPVAGFLADACRHPKTQLYIIGVGMMMVACGLVLSRSEPAQVLAETSSDETPWGESC
jgi:hypothetical protein